MFNPEDFRSRKSEIIEHFEKKGIDSGNISEYASLTGTPLIAIYTFIAEDYPEKKSFCEGKIKKLEGFYDL